MSGFITIRNNGKPLEFFGVFHVDGGIAADPDDRPYVYLSRNYAEGCAALLTHRDGEIRQIRQVRVCDISPAPTEGD